MDFRSLSGLTVNVGERPITDVPSAVQCYVEPDNLYTLRPHFKEESIDFIVSEDLIFKTKFHRILLKEWMNFCKVGGSVIIIFSEGERGGIVLLRHEVSTLFGGNVEFDWEKEGHRVIARIKKLKPSLAPGDSIDRWTFGIITNGKKDGQVDKIIESIHGQKVKNYEIIVCGKYAGKRKGEVKSIEFTHKDDRGWITKKKNLLVAAAKYQNLVIVHDRIIFSDGWYEGMKKYGNYFEALSCAVLLKKNNARAGDWLTYGSDLRLYRYKTAYGDVQKGVDSHEGMIGLLEYRDWDEGVFIAGFMNIFKKSVWERFPWDESLFWNEAEDVQLSSLHHKNGVVPRVNPVSICYTEEFRFVNMPIYAFDPEKLGKANALSYKTTRRFLGLVEGALASGPSSGILLAYFGLERAVPLLRSIRKAVIKTGVADVYIFKEGLGPIQEGKTLSLNGNKITVSMVKQKTEDTAQFEAKDSLGNAHSYRVRQGKKCIIIKYEK